jgi:phosphoribosylglycinamide formyltransferase 1
LNWAKLKNPKIKKERRISLTSGSKRWAVFISGQGSNFRAFAQADFAKISLVVSSSAKAPGILFARRRGIRTVVLGKPINWSLVNDILREHGINYIFLLGFMHLIPADFVKKWEKKILNLHPSLLPKYPGLNSISSAFNEKQEIGVTVHEVTAEMDAGPRVLQRIAVDKTAVERFNLEDVEFLTHLVEQRLVQESIPQWINAKMSS